MVATFDYFFNVVHAASLIVYVFIASIICTCFSSAVLLYSSSCKHSFNCVLVSTMVCSYGSGNFGRSSLLCFAFFEVSVYLRDYTRSLDMRRFQAITACRDGLITYVTRYGVNRNIRICL